MIKQISIVTQMGAKALARCDNKMVVNRLLKHPVKEIIECETVSQAI